MMLNIAHFLFKKYKLKDDNGYTFARNIFISALVVGYLDFIFIDILPVNFFKENIPSINSFAGRTSHGRTIEVLFTYFLIIMPYMIFKLINVYDRNTLVPPEKANIWRVLFSPFLIWLMFYWALGAEMEPRDISISGGIGARYYYNYQIVSIIFSFSVFFSLSALITAYYYLVRNYYCKNFNC